MQIFGHPKSRLIVLSCIQAIAISIFILFNPLGLKSTSQQQSEMVYLDTTASNFDASIESAVVVLIDEYTIEKYNLNYPVDYRNLSLLLKSISRHHPDSVFIDLLQNYKHSDELDYWLKRLKRSSERHSIFLAQDLDFDRKWRLEDKKNIRYKLSQHATLVPVSWKGPSNRYPLVINHNEQNYKTTALIMYQKYCETAKCELFQSSKGYDQSMVVRWSNKNSDEQMVFLQSSDGCVYQQRSMMQAFERHVTYGFQSKGEMDDLRVKCPPILTLSASEFLDANALDNPLLTKAIKNRAVFIGYDLPSSSDVVISPVHNQLPGVFNHAMAFVNLVSLDDEYWRSPNVIGECPIVGYCNFSYYDLVQLFLYAVVIGFSLYLKKSYELYSDHEWKRLVGYIACLLAVAVLVALLVVYFQHKAGPANWIALISILIISMSMLFKLLLVKCFYVLFKACSFLYNHIKVFLLLFKKRLLKVKHKTKLIVTNLLEEK